MDSIEDKIDELFSKTKKKDRKQLHEFVNNIKKNHDEANRKANKALMLTLLTWFITYAIGTDLIDETSISIVKFKNVQPLLLAAPIFYSALLYWFCSSLAASTVYAVAFRRCYKHLEPLVWDLDLEKLLPTPTLHLVEGLIPLTKYKGPEKWISRTDGIWKFLLVSTTFIIIFGGFAHISYILCVNSSWSVYLIIPSIVIGLAILSRGILFVATSDDVALA